MTKYYVQYIYIYQQVFVTKPWHVNDSLLWTLFVGDINLRQVAKVVLCNLVIPCLYHPRIFETGLHISDSKQQLKMVTHSMDLNESPAASFETCQFLLNMDVMSKFDKVKSDQRHKNMDWLFQDTWGPSLRLSLAQMIIIAKYRVWCGARRAAPVNVLPMPPRRTFSRSLSYFHNLLNYGRQNVADLETRQHTRETSGILWPKPSSTHSESLPHKHITWRYQCSRSINLDQFGTNKHGENDPESLPTRTKDVCHRISGIQRSGKG